MFDEAHARLFEPAGWPSFVFSRDVTACAWVYFDDLCSFDGWGFLTALAASHGDASIQVVSLDVEPLQVLTLPLTWTHRQYADLCDEELVGADTVRWWGSTGAWGAHGSRGVELAVVGERGAASWPRLDECGVLGIDSALRVSCARAEMKAGLLRSYDDVSWDPASERNELPRLAQVCVEMLNDRIDPIVAMRTLVELLKYAPKKVRRIAATDRLHEIWGRTSYLLMGADRDRYGSGIREQNDRNHAEHSAAEREAVREACVEIQGAIARFGEADGR